MKRSHKYIGINNEPNGGMTSIGKIIRDAWVFKLIPETESCIGWSLSSIDNLSQKINSEWDKYGCLVSHLPKELFIRHQRIHNLAFNKARSQGWSGENEMDE